MVPAARIAAAIEILDLILDGSTPEKALTGWGRTHRFAGSKDRAAIRDHVFQALRCRASFAWLGGAETGRGIMLGATAADGTQAQMFTGEGHAPPQVMADEIGQTIDSAPRDIRFDMPDWLLAHFDDGLGDAANDVLYILQTRAGVFLRVNPIRGSLDEAVTTLAKEGIKTIPLNHIKTALQVVENERRVTLSAPYLDGLVELQDPASQIAMETLNLKSGQRVLDLCAGGGGKALAMAAFGAQVTAHDIDPRRMVDLAPRSERAGVEIATILTEDLSSTEPFDVVLCDAPCSGSGTWRRTPAAKWNLNADRLAELNAMQDDVLATAAPLVRPSGILAYAKCSVFDVENDARVQAFIAKNPDFEVVSTYPQLPHAQGDGFYIAVLKRCG